MELQQWGELLAERLMPLGRSGQPVHLFVTQAELEAIAGPGQDLLLDVQKAVSRNPGSDPTRYERKQLTSAWRSLRDPNTPPPGLPFIVAEVLVCGEQVEAGSLAFYEPLSDAFGCPEIAAARDKLYEECLAPLWVDLTWWLETVNEGKRGFPTWRSIPQHGPRCIIGRPYTQMLLRREDWRDVEAFINAIGDDESYALEVVDRQRLAELLLSEFRHWAAREHRVSPRLLKILSSQSKADRDSLAYLLLECATSDPAHYRGESSSTLQLVVTLDTWDDRTLRVGVVAPVASTSVAMGDDVLELDEPGCPYPTPIPLTEQLLSEGITVQTDGGPTLVYRARDAVALSARDWALWSTVSSVDEGESVYVLCKETVRGRVERLMRTPKVAAGIAGVPEGWVLLGPSLVAPPAERDRSLAGLSRRQVVVPTFAGGLRAQQGRVYLVGGPPDVLFPNSNTDRRILVDGFSVEHDGSTVLPLMPLDLPVGHHSVTVDDVLRLSFDLIDPGWAVLQEPLAWRSADGQFVPETSVPCMSGAVQRPPEERWMPLLPVGETAVVLGDGPHLWTFSPSQAPWAVERGLPFTVFDPVARMAYPSGIRPNFQPLLAAALLDDGRWDVVALPGFENIDWSQADGPWKRMLAQLMTLGSFRHDPAMPGHAKAWAHLQEQVEC